MKLRQKKYKMSKYMIVPVQENDNQLLIQKQSKPENLTLAILKRQNKGVIITLTPKFENWFFNASDEDNEDFLFSLNLAEGMLKIRNKKD